MVTTSETLNYAALLYEITVDVVQGRPKRTESKIFSNWDLAELVESVRKYLASMPHEQIGPVKGVIKVTQCYSLDDKILEQLLKPAPKPMLPAPAPKQEPVAAQKDLLNTVEAAEVLAMKPSTLEIWRCRGGGPPFVKLGHACRYRREALEGWIEERRKSNTSQY